MATFSMGIRFGCVASITAGAAAGVSIATFSPVAPAFPTFSTVAPAAPAFPTTAASLSPRVGFRLGRQWYGVGWRE